MVRSRRALLETRYLPLLGRYLSGPVLRQLHQTGFSDYLACAFGDARVLDALGPRASMLDAAKTIFSMLCTHYRSDYVYRSAIANKIFLGRHSPTTTVLLPELRVWRSKADLVMLNGTSVAYEIKTGLDNLDRLDSQLSDYARMFDRIYVVTDEDHVDQVRSCAPDFVGVMVLTRVFTLRMLRGAASNADRVHVPTIVDALRRGEVVRLTKALCGHVPEATSVGMLAACRSALEGQTPRAVHDVMVSVLKARRTFDEDDFKNAPRELVSAYLESGMVAKDWRALTDCLTATTVKSFMATHGHLLPVPARETI